jgi:hypothetical protein
MDQNHRDVGVEIVFSGAHAAIISAPALLGESASP